MPLDSAETALIWAVAVLAHQREADRPAGDHHFFPCSPQNRCNSLTFEKRLLVLAQINGEQIDPLATIVHRDDAYRVGKGLVKRLKELIPRQQFKVPIQAAIGARIVASESISGDPVLARTVIPNHRNHACTAAPAVDRQYV